MSEEPSTVPTPSEFDSLRHLFRSLTRCIYVQTVDPGRWIHTIQDSFGKKLVDSWTLYAPYTTEGRVKLENYHTQYGVDIVRATPQVTPVQFLEYALTRDTKTAALFYALVNTPITPEMVKILRDIQNRAVENDRWITNVTFLNAEPLPEQIQDVFTVIKDTGPSPEEIHRYVTDIFRKVQLPMTDSALDLFRGLSFYQVDTVIAQAIILNKSAGRQHGEGVPLELFQIIRSKIKGAYET